MNKSILKVTLDHGKASVVVCQKVGNRVQSEADVDSSIMGKASSMGMGLGEIFLNLQEKNLVEVNMALKTKLEGTSAAISAARGKPGTIPARACSA
ncbi:hypothetical protein PHJA_002486200 [Phtheirospermum japonicum]|uniref:Uncharacterized protein n=1 Tax=Phtheirospermum japonicum TaxID=374723 RepID=A0A830D5A4_9LAMI|nr:hypothetical protein PHJA_002486200 [Phtheirospermum japonicum]